MRLLDRIVLNRLFHTILDFITKLCDMYLKKTEETPTETKTTDTHKPVRRKLLKRIFNE